MAALPPYCLSSLNIGLLHEANLCPPAFHTLDKPQCPGYWLVINPRASKHYFWSYFFLHVKALICWDLIIFDQSTLRAWWIRVPQKLTSWQNRKTPTHFGQLWSVQTHSHRLYFRNFINTYERTAFIFNIILNITSTYPAISSPQQLT